MGCWLVYIDTLFHLTYYPTHYTDCHQWLLGEDVDILPSLLLPLAGPEEFSEEETDKLPEDLQYLPTDKTREEDPDIRKMLLEALMKVYMGHQI